MCGAGFSLPLDFLYFWLRVLRVAVHYVDHVIEDHVVARLIGGDRRAENLDACAIGKAHWSGRGLNAASTNTELPASRA